MTHADLTLTEHAALAWLVRVTIWYGVGHHAVTPALLSLWAKGLAAVNAEGGTWSVTHAGMTLWCARKRAGLRVAA